MSKTAAFTAVAVLLTRVVEAIATRKQQRRERKILRLRAQLAEAEAADVRDNDPTL